MSISDKLRDSLSREITHFLSKHDNNNCDRCIKLIKDLRALKGGIHKP